MEGIGEDVRERRIRFFYREFRIPTSDELDLLDRVLQIKSNLTTWERDFVENLNDQREETWSNIQANKLREIADTLLVWTGRNERVMPES